MESSMPKLRIVGWLEGISFLFLLFVAMPLKYICDMPGAVRITGMIHGILFILYVTFVFIVMAERKWNFKTTLLALGASVVPFGTFWADKRIFLQS